jgi:hydrogenase maturation protease
MTSPGGPLVVLGVGNVLLRDDGVGVHVVRALARLEDEGLVGLPPGTSLVDGGTLGVDLLALVTPARALVLVDAVDLNLAPGAVAVIDGDALRGARAAGISAQRAGVGDLLAAAMVLGALPEAIALVGVQPAEVGPGLEPSDVARAAVPAATGAVVETLWALESWVQTSPGGVAGRRPASLGVVA